MTPRTFICTSCGNIWDVAQGTCRPQMCPTCGSEDLHREGCTGNHDHCHGHDAGQHQCGGHGHGDGGCCGGTG